VNGNGPGGSTAATLLARAQRRVLLLEKEIFPRFHVGESLLPYNREIFEQLGVWPKLEALGLIKKHGAQFHLGNGSKSDGSSTPVVVSGGLKYVSLSAGRFHACGVTGDDAVWCWGGFGGLGSIVRGEPSRVPVRVEQ